MGKHHVEHLYTNIYIEPRASYKRRKLLHTPSIIYNRGNSNIYTKHVWVGRSKWATPAGGRWAILGVAYSNIRAAGTPQPDLGEAVASCRYSNDNSSIFLSKTSFTPSLQACRWAGQLAGRQAIAKLRWQSLVGSWVMSRYYQRW